ncbi:MAG: PAS domain S-box protein, partial [Candidatus Tectomicrobia bacterium]
MHGADLTKEQLMAENVALRQRMVELAAAQTAPGQTEEVQQFVQFALDHSPDATCWIGPEAQLIYVNDAACHTLGYTRDELLAMTVHDIIPDLSPEVWHTRWRRMQQGSPLIFTSGYRTKDGQIVPVEITVSSLEFNGQTYHCVVARNMTERQRRNETWRQAGTIGTVGGSRAHDFNNILASILGYTELAQSNVQQGSKAWQNLQEVRLAIGQAKDLVQHIFPRLKTTTDDTTARVKAQEELPCGTGHILLVDDDEAIAL